MCLITTDPQGSPSQLTLLVNEIVHICFISQSPFCDWLFSF
ncbi:hypothetical protein OSU_0966 [Vibrio cholerae PS15]|nr:hypothetical protein OSU_0966 [Vibrio cholerae PS15]